MSPRGSAIEGAAESLHEIAEAADDADDAGWQPTRPTRLAGIVVLVGIAATYLLTALRLPIGQMGDPGYGLFPVIIGMLMVTTGSITLLNEALTERSPQPGRGWTLIGLFAAMACYAIIAPTLGHRVTATLVAAATLVLVGERRWLRVALYALAIGLGSYLVFDTLLGAPLPTSRYRLVF